MMQSWGETGFLDATLRFTANSCKETWLLGISPMRLQISRSTHLQQPTSSAKIVLIYHSAAMTKHYILSLDPSAKYEWDRCTLRDPINADHATLAGLVAQAVGGQPGAYLVAVNVEVQVLEAASEQVMLPAPVEVPSLAQLLPLKERVAS
jgi:hypothetical protein